MSKAIEIRMTLAGLSFRDLEYVAAVAEHLHFGRAAQECSASQPTLSTQVRKLEELLEIEIFERANRAVLVTERGAAVVAQVQVILQEGRRLREIVQAGAEPMVGRFRLGVVATLAPYLAPLLLGPVRTRYPRLHLLLSEGLPAQLLRDLEAGELDALLVPTPVRTTADLSELPLFREDLVLAVPRDHRLATAAQVTLADIPPEEVILLAETHDLHDQVAALFPRLGRPDHGAPRQQAASLEVLRQMVGAGLGCALMPQLSVQVGSLLDDMVAYRLIRGSVVPTRDISLFYRASFSRIRDTRLLRDLVREAVSAAGTVQVFGPGNQPRQDRNEGGR